MSSYFFQGYFFLCCILYSYFCELSRLTLSNNVWKNEKSRAQSILNWVIWRAAHRAVFSGDAAAPACERVGPVRADSQGKEEISLYFSLKFLISKHNPGSHLLCEILCPRTPHPTDLVLWVMQAWDPTIVRCLTKCDLNEVSVELESQSQISDTNSALTKQKFSFLTKKKICLPKPRLK